jgi:hypothetical protein
MERNNTILAFTVMFLLGWATGILIMAAPLNGMYDREDKARAQIERLSAAVTERDEMITKFEAGLKAANARVLVENARAKSAQEKLALILMGRRGQCQDR